MVAPQNSGPAKQQICDLALALSRGRPHVIRDRSLSFDEAEPSTGPSLSTVFVR